ncbi:MAG: TIR domain-containing protein [Ruminococcaceae bacterium]|nr:TIR domain-containing protein [Oscillospiraceae bacterium]
MPMPTKYITRKDKNGVMTSPEGKHKIFISHRRKDTADCMEKIVEQLLEYADFAIWYDTEGIDGGDNFNEAIQDAIYSADGMLLLVSHTALLHGYIWEKEVPTAQEIGIPIIPIIIFTADEEEKKDIESEVCRLLNAPIHCLHYFSGDFKEKFLASVKTHILDKEESAKIRQLFASKKHESTVSLSLNDQLLMAKGYCRGIGTKRNLYIAEQWLRHVAATDMELFGDSARQEKTGALLELMTLYKLRAKNGESTLSLFDECATEALELGCAEAAFQAYRLYMLGGTYEGSERQPDCQTALDWCTLAAEHGSDKAMYCLGSYYHNGKHAPVDGPKAVEWYEKAAMVGNSAAYIELANIYYEGLPGVAQDFEQAREWYIAAAENGSKSAISRLASMYRNGTNGTEPNIHEAIKWYETSAEKGNSSSMTTLGIIYRDGAKGLSADSEQALSWLTRAARLDNSRAMCALGKLYLNGAPGVERDLDAAIVWLEKSEAKNAPGAKQALERAMKEAAQAAAELDAIDEESAAESLADTLAQPDNAAPAKKHSLAWLFILLALLAAAAGAAFWLQPEWLQDILNNLLS